MKTAPVAELATQLRGVTYKKADASSQPLAGTVGVVRAGNIEDGELTLGDLVYVPRKLVSEKQFLREGDVLVATSSGSLDVVGKAARVRSDQAVAFGAFCKVLRPRPGVDLGYFAHFFVTPQYRAHVSRVAAGANINNLKKADLDDIEIPLPPIEEQRRLAAVLDAADALRVKRREALAKLDTLTRAIFLDMFGDPATGWRGQGTKTLAELIKVSSGQALTQQSITPGPYPVYGGNGVNAYHDQYLFDEPQIVIGRVGVYCGVVHQAPPRCWITDNALRVVEMDGALTPGFLAWALRVADLNQYASQAAQPLISGSRIYPVEIGVPPIAAQEEFATRASEVARQQRAHRSSAESLDELFASLQQRAFRGES